MARSAESHTTGHGQDRTPARGAIAGSHYGSTTDCRQLRLTTDKSLTSDDSPDSLNSMVTAQRRLNLLIERMEDLVVGQRAPCWSGW